MQTESIPGYTYGAVGRSPISMDAFDRMKRAALFGPDDEKALQTSYDIVSKHADEILDGWYGFIASQPQLLATFSNPRNGKPDQHYLDAVRERFRVWIFDTAKANYDQNWLDYQHEIGLRHRDKKNQTDQVEVMSVVPFRYLFPLVYPVTATLKPFLERGGHSKEDVERMHGAWVKSVLLQLTLWSYPYIDPTSY